MDAKELQILDWVSLGDNCQNARVGNIFTHNILATCEDGENVYLDYFFPIPLTEEILKINGADICYTSPYQKKYNIWLFNDKVCIEYKFSKQTEANNYLKIYVDGGERVNIHILYVHELQHALRLCGLNGLADNIKLN